MSHNVVSNQWGKDGVTSWVATAIEIKFVPYLIPSTRVNSDGTKITI